MARRRLKLLLSIATAATIICGCKDSIPEGLIMPDKMENLLYDYHMAQAVSSNIPYAEKYKKEPYKNYVLSKYDIDEELFDSSMAWYSRHTSYMVSIYENVKKRIDSRLEIIEDVLRMQENKFVKTISADTADIWGGMKSYVLNTLPTKSLILFNEKIDTTFHPGDKIVFKARYRFPQDSTANPKLLTTMSLTYSNDSTVSYATKATADRMDSIVVETPQLQLKGIALSFYISATGDRPGNQAATVTDIEFNRYHKPDVNKTSKH